MVCDPVIEDLMKEIKEIKLEVVEWKKPIPGPDKGDPPGVSWVIENVDPRIRIEIAEASVRRFTDQSAADQRYGSDLLKAFAKAKEV